MGPVNGPNVTLRAATIEDAERLWQWRNDELTRRNSISTAEVPWEDHIIWLEASLERSDRHLLIGEEHDIPVGQVRLDTVAAGQVVSITVAPEARGRGVALALLQAAGSSLTGALHAYAKPDNTPSLLAFEGAGYQRIGDEVRDGVLLIHLVRE